MIDDREQIAAVTRAVSAPGEETRTVTLSQRYAMDFRRAAERYAALGSAQQVADRIRAFHTAGVRHVTLDLVGPYEERDRQIARVAREVFPLLADLR